MPNAHNPLLFYYVNDLKKPKSNNYNRWLNDSFWSEKLPISSIKFVSVSRDDKDSIFDMYEIVAKIKESSRKIFSNNPSKKFILFVTSDIIVGPKLMTCFTNDIEKNECYTSLNTDDLFSILFNLKDVYKEKEFSGLMLWSIKNHTSFSINSSLVKQENVFKCIGQNDVIPFNKDWPPSKRLYEDSYCLFNLDVLLEDIFLAKETNYFIKTLRFHLYARYSSIKYRYIDENVKKYKIPNIVHLVWFSDGMRGLKFIEYLCLKSILAILKPEKVKIHGDNQPNCEEWKRIKMNHLIEWVQIERPLFKYGQNFTDSPIQHLADLSRLEILYNEGGIYSDFDVIWTKSVEDLRRFNVELIASNDITSYCSQFPLNIQIGVFLASPKSNFVFKWLDGYREKYHLFPGDYVAISMCEPYKEYEKHPEKVLINNRLQMIYFNGWSAFVPKYINVAREDLNEFNQNLDWLNDGAYAYHLPRHGSLFTKENFDRGDKASLAIKIAEYIFNLPYEL